MDVSRADAVQAEANEKRSIADIQQSAIAAAARHEDPPREKRRSLTESQQTAKATAVRYRTGYNIRAADRLKLSSD